MSFKVYTTQPELDARDGRANWFGVAPMMQLTCWKGNSGHAAGESE